MKTNFYNMPRRILRKFESLGVALVKNFYNIPSVGLNSIIREDVKINQPILDNIFLPPYQETGAHDDFTSSMKVIKFFTPKIVLEMGTAYGNMVANICNNLESVKVYTVNALPEQQTGSMTTCSLKMEDIGIVYKKYKFSDRVIQIYENTLNLDLSKYFNTPSIDLAIIDACHDTGYVINDFLKVKPFMRKKGIVLFHDTHPSFTGHLKASALACIALRARGYDIIHIRDTWWAVWVNK